MSTATATKPNGQTTLSAVVEERSVTYVPIGEKDEITLSVGLVEKFLCVKTRSGKIASREDVMKFVMLCKAQGLNPWVNDAYLVGYDTNDGPKFQLISAHQALLKRAELSHEYDGMESGVCVLDADGNVRERQGDLVVKGETLVGGWARVHRRDRSVTSYDSLSLATFSTGKSRWSADPAGMIVKCAEASALRKAFPTTLAQMYCREEMDREIENGGRDTQQVRSVPVAATKSEALVSILASRQSAKEPEQSNEHRDPEHDHETVIDVKNDEPVSFLQPCREWIENAGIECGTKNADGTVVVAWLPDKTVLLVCEVDPPEHDAATTHVVMSHDKDAITQCQNIVERSKKKTH